MKRRAFLVGSVTSLATSLAAEAQPAGRVPRVAIITTSSPPRSSATDEFIQGLRDLGYIEGRNITIEWRWGHGTTERFREYAADVVRLNVDVILAANAAAGQAARLATKTIPIVIPTMDDPVADGFVSSLARPGGNITGLTFQSSELQGKRLQSSKRPCRAWPELRSWWIATSATVSVTKEIESAAKALGLRPQPLVEVQAPNDFPAAFGTMTKAGAPAGLPSAARCCSSIEHVSPSTR